MGLNAGAPPDLCFHSSDGSNTFMGNQVEGESHMQSSNN
jgi:hypothetical protein